MWNAQDRQYMWSAYLLQYTVYVSGKYEIKIKIKFVYKLITVHTYSTHKYHVQQ
jgi:hypothetical protein